MCLATYAGLILLLEPEIKMDKEEITTFMTEHVFHKCRSAVLCKALCQELEVDTTVCVKMLGVALRV